MGAPSLPRPLQAPPRYLVNKAAVGVVAAAVWVTVDRKVTRAQRDALGAWRLRVIFRIPRVATAGFTKKPA